MSHSPQREIIAIPADTAETLRRTLSTRGDVLRLSYIGGPGDVVGTYTYWRAGVPDPRVPSVTYSAQLYELAKQAEASLQVVTGFAPPEEDTENIRFTQVKQSQWDGRLQYYMSQARYVRDVATAVDTFDPHVVIASLNFPDSGWKRLSHGRKLILTAHNTFWPMGQTPTSLKASMRIQRLRRRSTALDGAVCTSHECARQISAVTGARIKGRVEHPQIVEEHKVQARHRMRRLLYLGRIERAKGIFMLLEAFLELKQSIPDLDLTFAGAGSCDAELRAAIETAGSPDLRFLGRLDSAAVHREIATTDLVVCPTMSDFPEGLALVGLEAAAHGIPTLQSSIVPAIDLLGPACKTFKVDDLADLKRALNGLATDDAAYKGLTGHLGDVRPRLQDASLSWGSQLALVLRDL